VYRKENARTSPPCMRARVCIYNMCIIFMTVQMRALISFFPGAHLIISLSPLPSRAPVDSILRRPRVLKCSLHLYIYIMYYDIVYTCTTLLSVRYYRFIMFRRISFSRSLQCYVLRAELRGVRRVCVVRDTHSNAPKTKRKPIWKLVIVNVW
jgi:hypothetical protein